MSSANLRPFWLGLNMLTEISKLDKQIKCMCIIAIVWWLTNCCTFKKLLRYSYSHVTNMAVCWKLQDVGCMCAAQILNLTHYNILKPTQNGRHFDDDVFEYVSLWKLYFVSYSLKRLIGNIANSLAKYLIRCTGCMFLSCVIKIISILHVGYVRRFNLKVTKTSWLKKIILSCTFIPYDKINVVIFRVPDKPPYIAWFISWSIRIWMI